MPFLAFCVFIGPVVTGFEDAPHWAVLALGLPLVSKLDPRPLLGWLGVLLIAGVAWAALGLAWTPDPLGGALDLWHTVLLSLVVVAAAGIENPRRVMAALAYGIAVSVGVAVFQLAGYHPIATVNRPAGLFFNRDLFAEAAAPVFIWAALGKRWRLAAVCAIPLLICGSRVALLAAVAGWLYSGGKHTRWSAFVVMVAVLTITTVLDGKSASMAMRFEVWNETIRHLTLAGHGLGWFIWTFPKWEYVHSDALQALVELGPGALAFGAFAVLVLWRSKAALPVRAAFVAALVQVAVAFPLHMPASGFVAALLAGHLAGARHRLRAGNAVGALGAQRIDRDQLAAD